MSRRKPRGVPGRDVALFRYSLVRPLVDPRLSGPERGKLVRLLASRQHVGPAGC